MSEVFGSLTVFALVGVGLTIFRSLRHHFAGPRGAYLLAGCLTFALGLLLLGAFLGSEHWGLAIASLLSAPLIAGLAVLTFRDMRAGASLAAALASQRHLGVFPRVFLGALALSFTSGMVALAGTPSPRAWILLGFLALGALATGWWCLTGTLPAALVRSVE